MEHKVIKPDQTSSDPQRGRLRESLFIGAKVRLEGTVTWIPTVIRNLSDSGAMIDCPKGLKIDQRIMTQLRNWGDVDGTVMWIREGRAGVKFDDVIDPDKVRNLPKKNIIAEIHPTVIGTFASPLSKGMIVEVLVPGVGSLSGTIEWIEDKKMELSFTRSLFNR